MANKDGKADDERLGKLSMKRNVTDIILSSPRSQDLTLHSYRSPGDGAALSYLTPTTGDLFVS